MKKIFTDIRKKIEKFDANRESLINQARHVLKSSKLLIYSLHRDQDVKKNLESANKEKKKLEQIAAKNTELYHQGVYSDAMQEYAEALTYYHFLKTGKLVTPAKIKVSDTDFLLGVCDLTGELGRRAVMCAINKDYKEIYKIRSFVDEIFKEFLQFNLRNGQIRKKSDSIKWNLKKIEGILYDIEMKK